MTKTRKIGLALVAAAATVTAGCGGAGSTSKTGTVTLTGAGSTLVAPLVARWAEDYGGATLTYSGIGSGGGIAQATAKTVDFGASDAPLSSDQKAAAPELVQIPWALAATVLAVNVPGATGRLKLTGPLVADIYLGRITSWDDPQIRALNAGVALPHLAITPIHRSDASGDTFAFTDYLSSVSPVWSSKVGASTEVAFPGGSGGKGNAGVAAALQQTNGAIAYVAIAQVESAHLDHARLRNAAGQYPDPSPATIAAAARSARFAPDHSASIVNAPNGYPLSTFTYVLVRKGSSKLATLKPFLRYAVGRGQTFAAPLSFAPLPESVRKADLRVIDGL